MNSLLEKIHAQGNEIKALKKSIVAYTNYVTNTEVKLSILNTKIEGYKRINKVHFQEYKELNQSHQKMRSQFTKLKLRVLKSMRKIIRKKFSKTRKPKK